MGLFKDPRMDFTFIRTWDSRETYCAEEAMRRSDEIERLKRELAEYQALGSVDYLRNLVKSEKEKRLVALPCLVGDMAYTIENNEVVEWRISYIGLHPCHSGYANLYHTGNGHLKSVRFKDFGKTVFLNRDEATIVLGSKMHGGV